MTDHVSAVCQSAAQSLYAMKLLKAHGMDSESMYTVCRALVVSRLTYASPSWLGYASANHMQQIQAVLNRARRWGFYKATDPNIDQLCAAREQKLFKDILANPSHVLHQFLPPPTTHAYNLRTRAHNRQLPAKNNALISKNSFPRLLYTSLQ